MRLYRICIGASTLGLGTLVMSTSGAGAAGPCAPGGPSRRNGAAPWAPAPVPARPVPAFALEVVGSARRFAQRHGTRLWARLQREAGPRPRGDRHNWQRRLDR